MIEKAKNIFNELDLSYYAFDEVNNQFIPKGDFENFILRECINIITKLSEQDIPFEVTENYLIVLS